MCLCHTDFIECYCKCSITGKLLRFGKANNPQKFLLNTLIHTKHMHEKKITKLYNNIRNYSDIRTYLPISIGGCICSYHSPTIIIVMYRLYPLMGVHGIALNNNYMHTSCLLHVQFYNNYTATVFSYILHVEINTIVTIILKSQD